MSEPVVLVSARNLRKQFGAVFAARDITVDIHAHSVSGLIGTNGAGKTTFVNMLTGYLKPDQGQIFFDGHEITGRPPREITRMGITRSFQIPQLFDSLTALENVETALGIVGKPLEQAEEILARFELTPFADALAGILPEGVRKLLDIALAMVADPRVLLLDEPTSGVDSSEKFEIMDRIMKIVREAEVTAMFVEHDMEVVRRYSDRVLAFYDGSILAAGAPEEVMRDEKVLEYIIGRPLQAGRPAQAQVVQEGAHA
ncbi:ABC transporter ATP-binding protein [Castellaniella sp.]|uniref:ABC transporter ATP-binding protein n=1 Tax=Castellaniella sp. TaxID=1955812 RepID=UPI00355CD2D7